MRMEKRIVLKIAVIFIVMVGIFSNSVWAAEKYPSRPIEVVITFPPGGVSELTMRTWGKYMEKELGVPIVILPKPGGGGVIGYTYAANARPDGYTLLNSGEFITPILDGTATYKLEDLWVIAQMVLNGCVLAVNPDDPWKTFQEFMDYARKNPGVKWGHQGVGTMVYFRTENLSRQANLKLTGVPLKGDAEIITDLLGKHVQIGSLSAAAARPQAEGGKLRILFSFDPSKEFGLDPKIPDFATVFGNTIPDIEVSVYLVAPAKTPKDIIQLLEKTMEKISKDPEFQNDTRKINQMPKFVSGKTIMEERIPQKMNLIKAIMQSTTPAK
jgi:tripartite-type tricarboxylate transporter receptor subunit TctC